MTDPDFDALRSDVETATRLPEFDRVAQRARRVRRRDLRRKLVISLAAVVALLPAGVAGWHAAPRGPSVQTNEPVGPDRPDSTPSPSPSTAPVATIRAIAGLRVGSLYAAVDVCRPGNRMSACSLQVVPLAVTAQDQRGPIAVGELRNDPTDPLNEVTLQAVSPQALLLSGIHEGQRKYRRIDLRRGGLDIEREPNDHSVPTPGDQAVQLSRYGELSFIRRDDPDARALRVPTQPALRDPVLVTSVAPKDGWWVTGVDPATDEVAVAVSHDVGTTWTVVPLGLKPGMSDPVLTTGDGDTAYVFIRTAAGIKQRLTTDGGLSWRPLETAMPWPAFASGGDPVDRMLGAVVRGDGSLLVWLEEEPGAIFLESTDLGNSYRPANGPSGPIVAVQDGFAALGDPPLLSIDGRSWAPLSRPAVVPPT